MDQVIENADSAVAEALVWAGHRAVSDGKGFRVLELPPMLDVSVGVKRLTEDEQWDRYFGVGRYLAVIRVNLEAVERTGGSRATVDAWLGRQIIAAQALIHPWGGLKPPLPHPLTIDYDQHTHLTTRGRYRLAGAVALDWSQGPALKGLRHEQIKPVDRA